MPAFPFAWYQTTITGQASGNNSNAIEASLTQATMSNVTITFVPTITVQPIYTNAGEVTNPSAPTTGAIKGAGAMNLMAYHASTKAATGKVYDDFVGGGESFAAGIYFGYVDGAGNTHYTASRIGTADYWRYYHVNIKVETQNVSENEQTVQYTAEQIEAALSGITWDLTVERGATSKAVFYGVTQTAPANQAAATPAAEGAFETESDSGSLTLKADGAYTEAGVDVYFGVYIDGDSHSTVKVGESETVNGDFTVILSDSSNHA